MEFNVKFNEYNAVAGTTLGNIRSLSRVKDNGPDMSAGGAAAGIEGAASG